MFQQVCFFANPRSNVSPRSNLRMYLSHLCQSEFKVQIRYPFEQFALSELRRSFFAPERQLKTLQKGG